MIILTHSAERSREFLEQQLKTFSKIECDENLRRHSEDLTEYKSEIEPRTPIVNAPVLQKPLCISLVGRKISSCTISPL